MKADRFKPAEYQKSVVDERIVKKNLQKMERKASAPANQIDKPKKLEPFGGELEDIWGNDGKAIEIVDKSKVLRKFKNGFAKKDKINVKSVINPIGGLSYNPSMKEHKNLLIEVAKKEEEAVE